MDISTTTSVSIRFAKEERDTLEQAKIILKSIGDKLWQSDNDDIVDLGYLFSDTYSNIKDILEENY